MTLLDRLRAHKGGLVRIKTELFWYGGRGWDGVPGRLCILLDATASDVVYFAPAAATPAPAAESASFFAALLLIDGAPRWVWMVEADVELLVGEPQ